MFRAKHDWAMDEVYLKSLIPLLANSLEKKLSSKRNAQTSGNNLIKN